MQKRYSEVSNAIFEIANGKESATAKNIRPDLIQYGGNGDVTFIWGDKKQGLYHIGYRRGTETVKNVIQAVLDGNIVRTSDVKKTVTLEFNGYEAVLSLDMNGENKTWLLTGWEKDVPDATGEVSTQSGATQNSPTFSRADLGAGTFNIIPQSTEMSSGFYKIRNFLTVNSGRKKPVPAPVPIVPPVRLGECAKCGERGHDVVSN